MASLVSALQGLGFDWSRVVGRIILRCAQNDKGRGRAASNGSGKGRGSSLQGHASLGMIGRAGMVGIRLFEPGMPTFRAG